jgi:hypothetical protein
MIAQAIIDRESIRASKAGISKAGDEEKIIVIGQLVSHEGLSGKETVSERNIVISQFTITIRQ